MGRATEMQKEMTAFAQEHLLENGVGKHDQTCRGDGHLRTIRCYRWTLKIK